MIRYRRIFKEDAISYGVIVAERACLDIFTKEGSTFAILYSPEIIEYISKDGYIQLNEKYLYGFGVIKHDDESHPYGAYTIEYTAAKSGYGPLLYDILLSIAKDAGVEPDRHSVSKAARRVWDFYYTKRRDVENEPIDNVKKPENKNPIDDGLVHNPKISMYDRPAIDRVYWIKSPLNLKPLIQNHKNNLRNIRMEGASSDHFLDMLDRAAEGFFYERYTLERN